MTNLQASWVTQGLRMGQVALAFGANDMGSTMIEENVVRAAGVSHAVTVEELVRLIAAAGFTPVQRDTLYREVRRYPTVLTALDRLSLRPQGNPFASHFGHAGPRGYAQLRRKGFRPSAWLSEGGDVEGAVVPLPEPTAKGDADGASRPTTPRA